MGKDFFRDISVKLLFKPFYRSGLSANKITVLNFLTLGLGSIVLFLIGREILGLLTAGLMAMVDYIDGEIARARGGNSKLGQYLDTSLDWLYLMLLIGSISYYHNIMTVGYLSLIAITFGNWIEFNGNVKLKLSFPLGISHLIVIGILLGNLKLGIIYIAIVQSIRTIILYWRSIYGTYAEISHNRSP